MKRIETKITRSSKLKEGDKIYIQDPEKVTYNNDIYKVIFKDNVFVIVESESGKSKNIGHDKAVYLIEVE